MRACGFFVVQHYRNKAGEQSPCLARQLEKRTARQHRSRLCSYPSLDVDLITVINHGDHDNKQSTFEFPARRGFPSVNAELLCNNNQLHSHHTRCDTHHCERSLWSFYFQCKISRCLTCTLGISTTLDWFCVHFSDVSQNRAIWRCSRFARCCQPDDSRVRLI